MKNLLILIVTVSLFYIFCPGLFAAEAVEGGIPEGYIFVTDDGALKEVRAPTGKLTLYAFDTWEAMTPNKETSVAWGTNQKTAEKSLTDIAKDLRGRLLKQEDIADVFIGHRQIAIKFFPLSRGDVLEQIKTALGAPQEPEKKSE